MGRRMAGVAIISLTGLVVAGLGGLLASIPSAEYGYREIQKIDCAPFGHYDKEKCKRKIRAIQRFRKKFPNDLGPPVLALDLIREMSVSDASVADLVETFPDLDRMLDEIEGRGGCDTAIKEALFVRAGRGFQIQPSQYPAALQMFASLFRSQSNSGQTLPILLAFVQFDSDLEWAQSLIALARQHGASEVECAFAIDLHAKLGHDPGITLQYWAPPPQSQVKPQAFLLVRSPARYRMLSRFHDAADTAGFQLTVATKFGREGAREFESLAKQVRVPVATASGELVESLPPVVDYLVFYLGSDGKLESFDGGNRLQSNAFSAMARINYGKRR